MTDEAQWRLVLGGAFVAGVVLGLVLRGAARAAVRAAVGLVVAACVGLLGWSAYQAAQPTTDQDESSCAQGPPISEFLTQSGVRLWVCEADEAGHQLYSRGPGDGVAGVTVPQGISVSQTAGGWETVYSKGPGQVRLHLGADGFRVIRDGSSEPEVEETVVAAPSGTG